VSSPIGSATSRPPSAARCAALRQNQRITVKELSDETGLSIGMLSKIENGVTSPSLTTLQSWRGAERAADRAVPAVRGTAGGGAHQGGRGRGDRARGHARGHQYNLLGHLAGTAHGVTVEPYLITLTSASDVFPTFQHDGIEVIYMLEGVVGYRHGQSFYRLEPGDTLFFDADAPHGPEELEDLPIRFLSVISYADDGH
jgi:transcriptional regulator with XRE-family HTH domain